MESAIESITPCANVACDAENKIDCPLNVEDNQIDGKISEETLESKSYTPVTIEEVIEFQKCENENFEALTEKNEPIVTHSEDSTEVTMKELNEEKVSEDDVCIENVKINTECDSIHRTNDDQFVPNDDQHEGHHENLDNNDAIIENNCKVDDQTVPNKDYHENVNTNNNNDVIIEILEENNNQLVPIDNDLENNTEQTCDNTNSCPATSIDVPQENVENNVQSPAIDVIPENTTNDVKDTPATIAKHIESCNIGSNFRENKSRQYNYRNKSNGTSLNQNQLPMKSKPNSGTSSMFKTAVKSAIGSTTPSLEKDLNVYTDEMIRNFGYKLYIRGKTRTITSSLLNQPDVIQNPRELQCTGIPFNLLENDLLPIFHKFGDVYQMRIILNSDHHNSGKIFVVYMNEDCNRMAIKNLHLRKLHGRTIEVIKCQRQSRIFVKPIPQNISKDELFRKFNSLSSGLTNVIVYNSYENANLFRPFCYLDYTDMQSAKQARNCLNNSTVFGKILTVDWPNVGNPSNDFEETTEQGNVLYISNLRQGIRSADLRHLFCIYGDINDIDRDGTTAKIQFQNAKDANRAAGINKVLLGNDNVIVSLTKTLYEQKLKK